MTDDLDRLRAALKAAPPAPDPAARAAALARAMEKFDETAAAHQEIAGAARPSSQGPDRPGLGKGLRAMLNRLTTAPVLAATASAAALAVGLIVIPSALRPPAPGVIPAGTPSAPPAAAPAEAPRARADTPAAPAPRPEAPVAPATPETDLAKSEPEPEAATAGESRAATGPSQITDALSAPQLREEAPAASQAIGGYAGAQMQAEGELPDLMPPPQPADSSAFASAAANPVRIVAEEPVSTFSIDVDTASYAYLRGSILSGALPPAEAVRVEEMVNYFPYAYPAPEPGAAPFRPSIAVVQTPWNPDTRILRIGIQGQMPATGDRPPLNLVFLIDSSGSMQDPNKLPLLIQSFRLMLGQLRDQDRVAIVTYAGSAGEVLAPTPAADRASILAALDRLQAGGSTYGEAGLTQAYAVAETMHRSAPEAVTRVILATDGDFNVGIDDPEALKDFIATRRAGGTYLSVLGFGRGNLDDATMQALAQNGNGTAAYIDTLSEAQKVLGDQLTGALFPIADDVKIQMEFNPAVVSEYRLIGYETRALAREDFNNDRVDAGEIGAGAAVTALYEVTPVGSPGRLNDPLRYGAPEPAPARAPAEAELGYLKIRWKAPGEQESHLVATPVAPAPQPADTDTRFALAIAGFGQILTGSPYLHGWGWDQAIALAAGATGEDPFGYRAEAVRLMRLAQGLAR